MHRDAHMFRGCLSTLLLCTWTSGTKRPSCSCKRCRGLSTTWICNLHICRAHLPQFARTLAFTCTCVYASFVHASREHATHAAPSSARVSVRAHACERACSSREHASVCMCVISLVVCVCFYFPSFVAVWSSFSVRGKVRISVLCMKLI